jgi:hypothetical protein
MIDREALAARVRAVDASARVDGLPMGSDARPWTWVRVRLPHLIIHLTDETGEFALEVHRHVTTKHDRAILRAVLDYLDEAEGV